MKYSYVRFRHEVIDPAQPLGTLNTRDQFTAAQYDLEGDSWLVTITDRSSGRSVDVSTVSLMGGLRAEAIPAAEPAAKPRKVRS